MKTRTFVIKLHAALILVGLFCVACQNTRDAAIEGAINAFYKVQQSHDGEAFRSMVAPPLRDQSDIAQIIKDNEKCTILSWKIGSIEPGTPSTNDVGETMKTVKVPMAVKVQFADEKEPRTLNNQVDYWVLIDGKWYWFYTGFPAD